MQESHDQQACPSDSVQGSQIRAAGTGYVGDQDNDRRKELKQCAMDACHIFDEFIEQDDRGVEDGSSQTEEDTGKIAAPLLQVTDPDDHNQSQRGHAEAEDLFCGQFLAKQKR